MYTHNCIIFCLRLYTHNCIKVCLRGGSGKTGIRSKDHLNVIQKLCIFRIPLSDPPLGDGDILLVA